MKPQALIFDMDDLLVASSPIWLGAEQTLLNELGHSWTPELAIQYKGMNALDVAATIHRVLRPDRPVEACQKILRDALIAGFDSRAKQAMPGAADLVRRLRGTAPMAVASGSPLVAIESCMTELGIRDCFDAIITSESVQRGKPHPDVFLAAARALHAKPGDCLVFEDSLIGVQAARAAGMEVFCVPSGTNAADIRPLATALFASLADITAKDVLGAF